MTCTGQDNWNYRTAPRQCFGGGHLGHGPILPIKRPGFFARLFSPASSASPRPSSPSMKATGKGDVM